MHQNKNMVEFRLQAQGLYNFVRGLLGGLINGGAYIRGGGIKKKKRFEMSHSSVDGNTFTNFWLNFQASLYIECNSILGTKSKLTTWT